MKHLGPKRPDPKDWATERPYWAGPRRPPKDDSDIDELLDGDNIPDATYTVINIRGANGSGKSALIKRLLENYNHELIRKDNPSDLLDMGGDVEGYKINYNGTPIYIVGRYTQNGGGCDTIKTQDEICRIVKKYSKMGVTIFEGVIVSTLYSRYLNLSKTVEGMIWVYLNTPIEMCMSRVTESRQGKNHSKLTGKKSARPQETLEQAVNRWKTKNYQGGHTLFEDKFIAIKRTQRRAKSDGEKVIVLDHQRAYEEFCDLLNSILY